jgi:hypothetical protein
MTPPTDLGAEELVESFACRAVTDALVVDRGWGAADRKADGVVDDEEKARPASRSGNPAVCSGSRSASASASGCAA